jgi:hypothetical protein
VSILGDISDGLAGRANDESDNITSTASLFSVHATSPTSLACTPSIVLAQTGFHLILRSVTFGTGVGFGEIAADAPILRHSLRNKDGASPR